MQQQQQLATTSYRTATSTQNIDAETVETILLYPSVNGHKQFRPFPDFHFAK
jgi:hypothetical protein